MKLGLQPQFHNRAVDPGEQEWNHDVIDKFFMDLVSPENQPRHYQQYGTTPLLSACSRIDLNQTKDLIYYFSLSDHVRFSLR